MNNEAWIQISVRVDMGALAQLTPERSKAILDGIAALIAASQDVRETFDRAKSRP